MNPTRRLTVLAALLLALFSGNVPADVGAFKEDFGFGAEDARFTCSKDGKSLYAIVLGVPTGNVTVRAPAQNGRKVGRVTLLGSGEKLVWKADAEALVIGKPSAWPCRHAVVFKIE